MMIGNILILLLAALPLNLSSSEKMARIITDAAKPVQCRKWLCTA